jgi:hypothetical protein
MNHRRIPAHRCKESGDYAAPGRQFADTERAWAGEAATRLPRAVDGVSHIVQDRAGFVQDGFTARRQSGGFGVAIDQLDPDFALKIANLTR